jgi:putative DNA primase/helicase
MILEKALQEINSRYSESISDLKLTGKIERAGDKDHVWYVFRSWTYKSNEYQQIVYGSWRHSDQHTINSWGHASEDKGFKKAYEKHVREENVKLELEKQKKHKECREKWLPIYDKATPAVHEYLQHKNITQAFKSKVDHNNVMMVPAYHPDRFVGVQRIMMNPMTGKFEKKFSSGIEISGAYCQLTDKQSEFIFIAEGFATAATIQMAFPKMMVVCAFNANNLWKVSRTMRHLYPDSKIIIAADKDQSNTGEKEARKACKMTPQCIFVLPTFPSSNPAWTDFNDLMIVTSLDEVKTQLTPNRDDFITVTPLGLLESDYFYTSTKNNQIIKISASGHKNSSNLLQLAPLTWWMKHYAVVDEETGKATINWTQVTSDLFEKCQTAGLFNPEKIRGIGVWSDSGHYVLNDGQKVLPAPAPSSQYHYQKLFKSEHALTRELDQDELDYLMTGFMNIRYKNPKDYFYLSAWVMQAQIFSVLPWRFHLWLTGQRGNGKSEIIKWCADLCPNSILTMNATASGIRQKIKNNAMPVCFDESEPDSSRMDQILELARQMNTNNEAQVLRGTVSGDAIANNTQCVFLMGSIQTANLNTADASRFFIIEIEPPKGQTADEFDELSTIFKLLAKDKQNLFTTAFKRIPAILSSINVCKRHFREKYRLESRLADQLSTATACFWAYSSAEPITTEIMDDIIQTYRLVDSEYITDNQTSDSEACIHDLMTMEIDQRDQKTLAFCLRLMHKSNNVDDIVRYVGSHGMRYFPEKKQLFIASNSDKISSKMKKFPGYSRILSRDKSICVNPRTRQRVDGFGNVWGIVIQVADSILTAE